MAEHTRAEEQRRKDERYESEVTALQESLSRERASRLLPRSITPEQHTAIVGCLRNGPTGTVFLRPARFDAEATAYSKQVEAILREAGLEMKAWPDDAMSWSIPGAFLIVKELSHAPQQAVSIQKCFEASGITLTGYPNDSHPPDAVSIAVGARP